MTIMISMSVNPLRDAISFSAVRVGDARHRRERARQRAFDGPEAKVLTVNMLVDSEGAESMQNPAPDAEFCAYQSSW
jgi:hypothetical protein